MTTISNPLCLSISEYLTISHFKFIACSFSFIITLLALCTFIFLPNLKQFLVTRYIRYLLLANIIWITALLLLELISLNDNISWILTFLANYGWISTLLWGIIFTNYIYFETRNLHYFDKYEVRAILFAFGPPAIISLIIIIGSSNKNNYFNTTGIVIILMIILVTAMYYFGILINIKRLISNNLAINHIIRELLMYPMVSLVFATVYIIQEIFFVIECPTFFVEIMSIFMAFQPTIIAVIYGFNRTFRNEIRLINSLRRGVSDELTNILI